MIDDLDAPRNTIALTVTSPQLQASLKHEWSVPVVVPAGGVRECAHEHFLDEVRDRTGLSQLRTAGVTGERPNVPFNAGDVVPIDPFQGITTPLSKGRKQLRIVPEDRHGAAPENRFRDGATTSDAVPVVEGAAPTAYREGARRRSIRP
jgi:hypothetical protein